MQALAAILLGVVGTLAVMAEGPAATNAAPRGMTFTMTRMLSSAGLVPAMYMSGRPRSFNDSVASRSSLYAVKTFGGLAALMALTTAGRMLLSAHICFTPAFLR